MLLLLSTFAFAAPSTLSYVIYQNGQAIGQERVSIGEDGKSYDGTTVVSNAQMQFQTKTTYDLRGPVHYEIAGQMSAREMKIAIDRKGTGLHLQWTVNGQTQEKDVTGTELLENNTIVHYAHLARVAYGQKPKHLLVFVPQAFGTAEVDVSDDGAHIIELHRQALDVHFVRVQYVGGPMVELAVGADRNVYRMAVPLQNFSIVADAPAVNAYAKEHTVKFPHDPDEVELAGAREKTVTFQSNGLTLYGTMTLPKNASKAPMAILFQGSGPQSRDARMGVHRVLADIAGLLAKAGIASLRYDKRFYSYRNIPVGVEPQVTFESDVLDDAKAAVAAVKQTPPGDFDVSKLLLVGFEAGATAALSLAGEANALVLIAPPVTPPDEAMAREQAHILRVRDHAEQAMIDKTLAPLRAGLKRVRDGSDEPGISLSALYLKTVLENGAVHFADRVTRPVLVLQGAKDFQVEPSEALALVAALRAGGADVTYTELPKMNHALRDVSVSDGRDYEDTAPMSGAFAKAFIEFVQKRITSPR